MKIYLVRHGEYQNPEGIVPYRLPGYSLSDHGKKQVELIAVKLKDQKIRALYTSPIQRCVESATILGNARHLYPNQKSELIEVDTPLQGIKAADLPSDIYQDARHIEGGGETREVVYTRMNSLIEKLKLTSQNSTYLIVSHADPIIILLAGILKKPVRYIPMGGLVMLDYSQKGIPKYQEII